MRGGEKRSMRVAFTMLLSLTLVGLVFAGCGGRSLDVAEPRVLTVDEYLEWCSKFASMPAPETYGDGDEFYSMIYHEGRGLNPPTELGEYSQAYVEGVKLIRDTVSTFPPEEFMDFDAVRARMDSGSMVAKLEAARVALPVELSDDLTNCF